MHKPILVGSSIIVGGLLIWLIVLNLGIGLQDQTYPVDDGAKGFETKSTGTTAMGDVAIQLSPHGVNDGKMKVDVSIDTHSVELGDFDLKEITTLHIAGKKFKPVEASGLSGHHASGMMVFDINVDPDEFTIVIEGIPEQHERRYVW
ncbi:hypothetical protein COV20_05685 [Candidatus Woesearchaeota archaeon CG10_big_fil_rev_8_21_14_0_10_45_16]|nr:MAG: hypothetical protein COV20_05685 [Candidatus Woesearchaeota archaeon CG10_big_fil_rev_8_21_14_0_10_45_16]